MRLLRVGPPAEERFAIQRGDEIRLLPEALDFGGRSPITLGWLARVEEALDTGWARFDPVGPDIRVGSPIPRPGKIVCIGLNYRDHAREIGVEEPPEPIIFMKASNTMGGPYDDLLLPPGSEQTDWEVELGVVIGRSCRYLESQDEAMEAIAGWVVCNDVSDRHNQLERGGQWVKGKSAESFNPTGPWLVTTDEVDLEAGLGMELSVNGVVRQSSSTSQMVFSPYEIVHYLSQFMVLEPGDLINTGTPAGVALGSDGTPYLREGDVITLEIEGLGRQRQVCVRATP